MTIQTLELVLQFHGSQWFLACLVRSILTGFALSCSDSEHLQKSFLYFFSVSVSSVSFRPFLAAVGFLSHDRGHDLSTHFTLTPQTLYKID